VTLSVGGSGTVGPPPISDPPPKVSRAAFAAQLARVVDSAIDVVRVDYVGLMLLDDHDDLLAAGSSDERGFRLETVQIQLGMGPAFDAMQQSRSVAVTDLSTNSQYAALWAGLPHSGARAVLSCPLRARGGVVGNFEAGRVLAHDWTAAEIRRAETYARVIGLTLDLAAETSVVGKGAPRGDEEGFDRKDRRMPVDNDAMSSSLRRLGDRHDREGDLTGALNEVTDACVELFHVAGSGIMLADDQNISRYVAASNGPGRILEIVESETGQGPCTEAFVTNRTVPITDLTTEDRWPDLVAAVTPLKIRAVLGVPVRLGAVTVGTLDVYREHPHRWDDTEQRALARYADLVETTIATALAAHKAKELAGQLQYALDYRVVIERGVGYLMARDSVDAVTAFNRLRRAARSTQRKIGDIATELIERGRLPTDAR
jgi:GAF domain-containing protein